MTVTHQQLTESAQRIVARIIPDQAAHDNLDVVASARESAQCVDEIMAECGVTRARARTAFARIMRERRGEHVWGGRRKGAGNKRGSASGPRFKEGDRINYAQLGGNGIRGGYIEAVSAKVYWIKFDDGTLWGLERGPKGKGGEE